MTIQRLPAIRSCLSALLATMPMLAAAGTPADWDARSRALADQLMGQLKTELGAAMQQGGPIAAIGVCKTRAPEIASRLSAASGAEVGRTALRVRNPANAPDELERAVLEQFAAELAVAKEPLAIPPEAVFELRAARGIEHRYMRAIPMQPLCVACHGKAIAPDLAAAIRKDYPDDAATGFEPGQLRGAVTVVWPAGR